MADDDRPNEIVIIRRRREADHDDVHGGVWKVAFADFMTAMMAFFLVLWIVNSTSKETRASVARYFNPVRLSDTTPARKGLQEPREEDFDASAKATEPSKDPGKKAAETPPIEPLPKQKSAPETKAAESAAYAPPSAAGTAPTVVGAETFRDPFEPVGPSRDATGPIAKPDPHILQDDHSKSDAALIRQAVAAVSRGGQAVGPAIEVRETPEGTLISLTDRADYGMFAIGSTEPNAALVKLVTELGGLLKPAKNLIVVRGYTDARRYRKAGFDNWRLSTGRAQSACDMLLRGGVDESRIDRIEGYADHNLRNAKDSGAAENRRVEILLRKDTR